MMLELFVIGENNMATLNKPWISLVPAFRALLARDKGGAEDGSGKYKKKATREFTYIYHLLDFRSPLENYPPEERKALALEYSTIQPDHRDRYEKDDEFQEALKQYQEFLDNASPALQSLRHMKKAKHAMNSFFEQVDFTLTTDKGVVVYDILKVQTAMTSMPKLELAIDEMERKVKLEMHDNLDMRGGAEKGDEEDPD